MSGGVSVVDTPPAFLRFYAGGAHVCRVVAGLLGFVACEVVFIEVEIPSGVVVDVVGKAGEFAAFTFCWASEAFSPVDESAYTYYIQKIVLVFRCDVFHVFRHEFGAEAVFGQSFHSERICNRGLAYAYNVVYLDHPRRFGHDFAARCAQGNTALLAAVGGYCAGLEYAHGPKPFVDSYFCFHIMNGGNGYLLLKSHMAVCSPARM